MLNNQLINGALNAADSSSVGFLMSREIMQADLDAWSEAGIESRISFYESCLNNLADSSVAHKEVVLRIQRLRDRSVLVSVIGELEARVFGDGNSSKEDLEKLRDKYEKAIQLVHMVSEIAIKANVNLDSNKVLSVFQGALERVQQKLQDAGGYRVNREKFREIERVMEVVKNLFVRGRSLEQQLSTSNYDSVVHQLYAVRVEVLEKVGLCKELINGSDFLPVRCWDMVEYFKAVKGSEVLFSVVDSQHVLVELKVRLIEKWYSLKKLEVDHPMCQQRRWEFLDCLEKAILKLKSPMEFGEVYELYASDLSKLRSLVVSYFMKKDKKYYVQEFNKYAKDSFKDSAEVSFLLKEFALFFSYQAAKE